MPDSSTGKNSLTWFGIWFIIIQIIMILVIIPNSWLREILVKESSMLKVEFGEQTGIYILDKGYEWYESAFVKSGINDSVYNFFIISNEERDRSIGLERFGQDLWFPWLIQSGYSLKLIILLIFERVSQLVIWLPYFVLVMFSASIDGYLSWRIKYFSFDYSSPWFHRFSIRSIKPISISLILLMFLPLPIPPLLLPIVILVATPTIVIALLSNLPKKI
jgi:hypothetical protein